jgi:hypothetical protein
MTLTTTPTIRPSSPTRTSFDLRSARRHRWRWIAVGVDGAIAVAWMLLAAPAVVTRVSPR